MPNINVCVIGGHLTRDPQLSFTPSQTAVCECGIAVSTGWGDKKKPCFVDFKLFGKSAESFNAHAKKGRPFWIRGELTLDQWQAQDGTKRSKHRIVAGDWGFLGAKKDQTPAATAEGSFDIPF